MTADATASVVQFGKLPHDMIVGGALSNLIRSDLAVYLAIAGHCCSPGSFAAFPSIKRISACAGISERTVHRSIDRLEKMKLVTIQRGGGRNHSNEYTLTTNGDMPSDTVPEGKQCQSEVERVTKQGSNGDKTGVKRCHQGGTRIEEKNNRKKRDQAKKRSPKKKLAKFNEEEIERVYQAYPRLVGKGKALPAIAKAIELITKCGTSEPAKWLLERVKKFAASPAGQRGKFTPHCSTWINAGRFDDDDREWAETNGRNQAASSASVRAQEGKYDGI